MIIRGICKIFFMLFWYVNCDCGFWEEYYYIFGMWRGFCLEERRVCNCGDLFI